MRDTALAHSHLWFYRDAIEASLAAREWAPALNYASALEDRFEPPLPWVELVAERARSSVAAMHTSKDEATTTRLEHIRATATAAGNGWPLGCVEKALTETGHVLLDQ